MKKKILLVIVGLLLSYVSCINTVIELPEDYYEETPEEIIMTKSTSVLTVKIINNANNIKLTVDTCYLKNVYTKNDLKKVGDILLSDEKQILFQGDTLCLEPSQIPTQPLMLWNPYTSSHYGRTHLMLKGDISMINPDFNLHNGETYIPVVGMLDGNTENGIILKLENQCPWFVECNRDYIKVLKEITFNVSVSEWNSVEVTTDF
jgi:hypothetical protein